MTDLEVQKMFLDEVEEERERAGFTKTSLSLEAFNSPGSYGLYLTGNRIMSIKTAHKLAQSLGMKAVLCLMEIEDIEPVEPVD